MKRVIQIDTDAPEQDYFLISDVHFDNPKCERDVLKRRLDEAKRRNAKILINGDLFDLMQGRGDKRSNKKDLRPEYLVPNYFDAVLKDAVDFFAPYAQNLAFVGYGNHETSSIKYHEFDLLSQFVALMRYQHNSLVQLGGYTGVITLRLKHGAKSYYSFAIYYHHGFGGGGAVTRGVIQNQRKDAQIEGVDCIWMGHVHELYHILSVKTFYDRYNQKLRKHVVHHIRTSTYKQESGEDGWHEERGAPEKPIGGFFLNARIRRKGNDTFVEPNFEMALW